MAHSGLRSVWAAALGAMIGAAGTSAALAPATAITSNTGDDQPTSAAAGNSPWSELLDVADEQARAEGEVPAKRRTRLLERIANGHNCFVQSPTPEQLANIAARFGGRNPAETIGGPVNRFFLQASAWDGSGLAFTTQLGRGRRINLLTFSFPADGTEWSNDVPNDLNARLETRFGQAGTDAGRELFRQTLAGWKLNCGVDYLEVCDDNAPLSFSPPPSFFAHGDIRFGANPLGTDFGVLAFNYFPEAGGDMVLNSSYFDTTVQGNYYELGGSGNYRRLRNAIAHEHGHGLGFRHAIPCFEQKLMEPFASTVYDTITIDERRGAQHNYGDRYAGNHTPAAARELGLHQPMRAPVGGPMPMPGLSPSSPRYASTGTNYPQAYPLDRVDPTIGLQARSIVERDLSTNGRICGMIGEPAQAPGDPACMPDPADPTNVTNLTGQDWFKFTLETPQEIRITVDPTGGSYDNGRQVNMCTGPFSRVFAERAGNLNVELWQRDSMGNFVAFPLLDSMGRIQGSLADPGLNEIIETQVGVPLLAGTYYIRVYDVGPNTITLAAGDPDPVTGEIPQQTMPTQLYDLFVRIGPRDMMQTNLQLKNAPLAIAGVDKIVRIGQVATFIGDIYSRVQEPNTPALTQRLENFEWDLDGDGSFELTAEDFNNPAPGEPANSPRSPFKIYGPPNRIVPVTLKVIDNNLTSDTDTIFVKVVGEPITITGVAPNTGVAGSIVPIVITGTGLGAVTDIRQINFFDPNVVVVGQPRVSADGTTMDNISLALATTAAPGPRDLQISDGCAISPVVPMSFFVTQPILPPPQDDCVLAGVWPADFGVKSFDSQGATAAPSQAYPGTPCFGTTIEGDVWYRWTVPNCTSSVILATPATAPGFDVRMAVYNADCPPTGALIACDSSFPLRIPVTPGQNLVFRIGGSGPGQTGMGTVTLALDPTDPLGACCRPGMLCFCAAESQCDQPGDDFTAALACNPEPCPGRCCFDDGTCQASAFLNACVGGGGQWTVAGTTCSPGACPPAGACCNGAGCLFITAAACTAGGGSRFLGVGSTCTPNDCTGACCDIDGSCTVVLDAAACTGQAIYRGNGTACSPNNCEQPVACCNGQTCVFIVARACAFNARPNGTTCAPSNECAGACCGTDGSCSVIDSATSCPSGSSYLGNGTTCAPNTCPQPVACCNGTFCRFVVGTACSGPGESALAAGTTCAPSNDCAGACCNDIGGCLLTTPAACSNNFLGAGTVCTPNPCPQPVACCNGTTCRFVVSTACVNVGEGPLAAGTTCAPVNSCGGACCAIDGTCSITSPTGCTAGGTFQGRGTTCGPGACPPAGACCDGSTCLTRTSAACAAVAGARFLGSSITCAASTCTSQACCTSGGCIVELPSECSRVGGSVVFTSNSCTPNPCTPSVCCTGNTCTLTFATPCVAGGGDFFSGLTTCTPDTCEPGACCSTSGCGVVVAAQCTGAGASYQGAGTSCTPSDCAGACCTVATGVCTTLTRIECEALTGTSFTPGLTCSPIVCRRVGACCIGTMCSVGFEPDCTGLFQGQATACGPTGNPTTCCPANIDVVGGVTVQDIFGFLFFYFQADPRADFNVDGTVDLSDLFGFLNAWFVGCDGAPTGACCLGSSCVIATDPNCLSQSGVYQGDGVACTPTNPCATLAMGACCTGATCTAQMASACTGPNSFYAGDNTTCNPPGNYTAPCCLADFNQVGGLTVQDILDFLNAYFNADLGADYNGSGTLTTEDIFGFLAAYLSGGC